MRKCLLSGFGFDHRGINFSLITVLDTITSQSQSKVVLRIGFVADSLPLTVTMQESATKPILKTTLSQRGLSCPEGCNAPRCNSIYHVHESRVPM